MSIKVFVVDDSAFMRKIISDILEQDKDIEILDTARNGKDALEKLKALKPDIITLDIEMPIMNGIECLESIMKEHKVPVVMLSSLTTSGAEATIKALELGAVDFITKPDSVFDMSNNEKKQELTKKIKTAAKVKRPKTVFNNIGESYSMNTVTKKNYSYSTLVAIGTSTGGPKALQAIIPYIHKDINGSILVVQHMPPGFTKSLAKRLNSLSKINVKEAEDGEKVLKGYCYIAPGGFHMEVKEKRSGDLYIELNKNEPVTGHRPSVDVMMDSVSKISTMNKMGIILTGMGADGATGIKKIKENRGYTIAQDENSCVVFGMPKSAIKNNAIDNILPLNKIATEIVNKVGC
ncbi:protein-glutamate methylesterase/protein-glutamine glutaminase [Caldisalinibacter kiritimatiensis]|uniref:Protein-glutamate methylesterase/protein-glutamine glutaminase n=1 Tax=Caldisalinibacter kiritimatiensis TaxID=1304284 RepID=R1ARE2_9FIRM|nr:chemotaxis response regulator protein-glutamate methylesterase [Caldisalinibacter kiritimatiensis]EOC99727.1 Chemotaxis response regulator protein-glutamate methylesterase CheB [Caldisalinibacter kiritimatiensis]